MSKVRKKEEPPKSDARLIDLIDSTLGLVRDSDRRGYFTNQLTAESKVSYLPVDCEGNSAWQLRWGQGNRVGVSARRRVGDKRES